MFEGSLQKEEYAFIAYHIIEQTILRINQISLIHQARVKFLVLIAGASELWEQSFVDAGNGFKIQVIILSR